MIEAARVAPERSVPARPAAEQRSLAGMRLRGETSLLTPHHKAQIRVLLQNRPSVDPDPLITWFDVLVRTAADLPDDRFESLAAERLSALGKSEARCDDVIEF